MKQFVFEKQFKDGSPAFEVSYEKALDTLLTTYRDCDMTRDMLKTGNLIMCRFSVIRVYEVTEWGRLTSMPGLYNLTPDDARYDDDGNRLN